MKKTDSNDIDELEDNYDFDYSKAKPNRFAKLLNEQEGIIVISPELRHLFPDSDSVNKALQQYLCLLNQVTV